MLKLYTYGYLNRIQPSRRLEREAQRNGADVAHRPARAGLQDHRRLPPRQRQGQPQRMPQLHCAVPAYEALLASRRGHRRQQVQGRQQPRPQFLTGQDRCTQRVDRAVHPALPRCIGGC
ncbi:hypothetical protein [Variovorax sp. 22077]|uniref:hypothetical protein n=1 Tax=Variovorax sp. 22077 TaxID=3453867 RepID=UPI003F82F161